MRDVAGIKPAARAGGKYIYVSMGWGNLTPAQKQALSRNGFKKHKEGYRAEITRENAFFVRLLTGCSAGF